MDGLLATLASLHPVVVYAILAGGAALENIVPPIPADTFVLLGAFLAASGRADATLVFVFTWVANVASALAVYAVARRHGRKAFATGPGRRLLQPRQLEQIAWFYARWGTPAIFMSRFIPAFRAIVPVFAGVTHVPLTRVLLPLASASAIWYGALVYLGAAAGRNFNEIVAFFDRASAVLLVLAGAALAAFLAWWWRSRHSGHDR